MESKSGSLLGGWFLAGRLLSKFQVFTALLEILDHPNDMRGESLLFFSGHPENSKSPVDKRLSLEAGAIL